MIKIAPSILAADFSRLAEETARVENAAEYLHLDVMDGVFVPNISFGFPVIEALRPLTACIFDVHLMIVEPEKYVRRFVEAGSDYVTFHYEATECINKCIDEIHAAGAKAGISIKPATPASVLKEILPKVELVLVPGQVFTIYPVRS